MSALPILLHGTAVRALVVGGGAVGTRKASTLLGAGAAVRVVAPAPSATLRALATAPESRLRLLERPYAASDIDDANLVVAATSVREVNAAVARDAERAGRLASIADAPHEGAWTAMATHDAGGLVVGVSAGGVPAAAVRVRDAIAARFDVRYGEAVTLLHMLRGNILLMHDSAAWRRMSDEMIADSFCADVESGALKSRLLELVEPGWL